MTTRSQARSVVSNHTRELSVPRRLGQQELSVVEEVLADVAPDWTVQLDGAFAEEPCLVVMPEEADDTVGPTFVLHRVDRSFCLDQYHWETYSPIGEFPTLHDAVRMLRSRLTFLSMAVPSHRVLH